MISKTCNTIFGQSIGDYHRQDDVHAAISNPYATDTLEHLLYLKNWIDTVQWHLEDIIRNPAIDPVEALRIKRWIDASNQERTDVVEFIDSWFLKQYEAGRSDATEAHREACRQKLRILLEQQEDLSAAIDGLLDDIAAGKKYMKVYRQMKMYNDASLNPVLYGQKGAGA